MSSRLCLKHLPLRVPLDKLVDEVKRVFSPYGQIQQVQPIFKRDGKKRTFRGLMFLGYASEDQASAALQAFSGGRKPAVLSTRITVEPAHTVENARSAVRAYSKYTEGSSAWAKANPEEAARRKEAERRDAEAEAAARAAERRDWEVERSNRMQAKTNATLKEFLDAASGERKAFWEDFDAGRANAEDLEEVVAADSDDSEIFDATANATRAALLDEYSDAESESEHSVQEEVKPKKAPKELVDVEKTKRIFIRNLSFDLDTEAFKQWINNIADRLPSCDIASTHISRDRITGRCTGVAFIGCETGPGAKQLLYALDGQVYGGRLVHALPGQPGAGEDGYVNPQEAIAEALSVGQTFKAARKAIQKRNALHSKFAWATTTVRQETVAENAAQQLLGSRNSVLDLVGADNADAATVVALAGAAQTREAIESLASQGVNLGPTVNMSAKQRRDCARSPSVLLVKNLPPAMTRNDLFQRFAKHARGAEPTVLLSKHNLYAVVTYEDASDARRAIRAEATGELKLEQMPMVALDPSLEKATTAKPEAAPRHKPVQLTVAGFGDKVTTSGLYGWAKHLMKVAKTGVTVLSADVATGRRPDGSVFGLGRGVVRFPTKDAAKKALVVLRTAKFNGDPITVSVAAGTFDEQKAPIKKVEDVASGAVEAEGELMADYQARAAGASLLIRNVDFHWTQAHLHTLLAGVCAQVGATITKLRLPVNASGRAKGYAFADFATGDEAQRALEIISVTAIGRRTLRPELADSGRNVAGAARARSMAGVKGVAGGRRRQLSDKTAAEDAEDAEMEDVFALA